MPTLATTGAGGVLGLGLAEALKNFPCFQRSTSLGSRSQPSFWENSWNPMDLLVPEEPQRWLQSQAPQLLLHAGAMTRLDDCEANPKACHRTNLEATRELCAAALEIGTSLLFVSTDQVFDGRAETYSEDSTPSPIHNYGRSKAEAEQIVLEAGGVVARLPLLLGGEATPQRKGADTALRQSMQAGQTIKLFEDEFRAPLPASSAAQGLLLLLEAMKSPNPPRGVFHFSGNEPVSRLQLGQMVQTAHHLSATLLPTQAASWNGPPRPLRLVLTHERATEELSWKAPNLRQYLSADSTP